VLVIVTLIKPWPIRKFEAGLRHGIVELVVNVQTPVTRRSKIAWQNIDFRFSTIWFGGT
jgi:hypothetical protein